MDRDAARKGLIPSELVEGSKLWLAQKIDQILESDTTSHAKRELIRALYQETDDSLALLDLLVVRSVSQSLRIDAMRETLSEVTGG